MTSEDVLRLGTRASPLALVQTEWVAARLRERRPGLEIEIRTIRTSGDRWTGPLHEAGGKALFLKEIEEAMVAGDVDAGVHSMKDLPAELPEGLDVAAVPVREDPRDVLVAASAGGLEGLPKGARVGTGSLRRTAQLRHLRPDLDVVGLRGNVGTRLGKMRSGELQAVVLAAAGLRRLALEVPEAEPLDPDVFLPAIGQGALAIEAPVGSRWWSLLRELEDERAARETDAERGFLAGVGGDCQTPIAAWATVSGAMLRIRAMIADPSGLRLVSGGRIGSASDAAGLGRLLAVELLDRGGREILEAIAP